MSDVKRAILIAAGRGRRLGAHTDEMPKSMVAIGAKPILGWVWEAFERAGIEELVVIRGYRGDVLEGFVRGLTKHVTVVDNDEWETNNVLLSMAKARAFFDRPCLVSYSDILFTPAVAAAAVASPAEIGLVIDREFRRIYEGRTEHPLDEGEVADLMPDGSVARVGKRALPPSEAIGEFIGLMKLGPSGVVAVARSMDRVLMDHAGRDATPFQRAATFRGAYLTDLLQFMIDGGIRVDPVFIEGQWREIDTGQDLERARVLVESTPEWR